METKRFTAGDVGCYADGAFGHRHIRDVLIGLLENNGGGTYPVDLCNDLMGPMSDDASEEDEALDVLNSRCDGVYFTMSNGDLLLVEEGWEE